jgi:hypothetical protein
MPHSPMTVNHTNITGPNSRPTTPVPSRCTAKRQRRIAAVIGTTRWDTDGAAISTPSIADSTEIAGVMMLSPKNNDAPNTPSSASACGTARPLSAPIRRTSVISAMIPPSPSLSARMMNVTYLTETMIVIDQKTSEMTP